MKTGSPESKPKAIPLREKGSHLILPTLHLTLLPRRMMGLFSCLNYGKRGLLDRTHTRLLTCGSLRRLFQQAGFAVIDLRGIPSPFHPAFGLESWIGKVLLEIKRILPHIWPSGFSYQNYCGAQPSPTLDKLLAWTLEHSIKVIPSNEIVQCYPESYKKNRTRGFQFLSL